MFIISCHIYPGARYKSGTEELWHPSDAETYLNIIKKYSDKIIIEIAGHDHLADLRYHNTDYPNAVSSSSSYFHNMIVAAGVTSSKLG
jgi:hypothetical protein